MIFSISDLPRRAESARTPFGVGKFVDDGDLRADERDDDELGDPLARRDRVVLRRVVQDGNDQLSAVIGIDDADSVRQRYAVLCRPAVR